MPDGTADVGATAAEAVSPALEKKTRKRGAQKRRTAKAVARPKAERGQSSIGFPYNDLDTAVSVAQAMINAGGVPLSREQLAGAMGQAVGSGSFVLKTAAARIFGLTTISQGKHELTPLGFEVVGSDESARRAARAKAFLTVPLYQKVYEEFKGKQLPPRPHGLEQAFVKFGVAVKQRTNARLAFDKSARQAGFFDNGNERLVEPIIAGTPAADRTRQPSASPAGEIGSRASRILRRIHDDEENGGARHPFIQGLLDTLPAPNSTWTVEGRAKWLQAAANIFELIYTGDGIITIHAKAAPPAE